MKPPPPARPSPATTCVEHVGLHVDAMVLTPSQSCARYEACSMTLGKTEGGKAHATHSLSRARRPGDENCQSYSGSGGVSRWLCRAGCASVRCRTPRGAHGGFHPH